MPQLLISADASDPAASSNAIAKASVIVSKALNHDFVGSLNFLKSTKPNVDVIIHPKYNPQGITQYNIVHRIARCYFNYDFCHDHLYGNDTRTGKRQFGKYFSYAG
ncbi:hypothetical protein [Psychrosphaera algicola]|uniref:Uncharacterized protein n=1 Tax=Psychrosphaera algicola TaxID=3023714 RepID=A0ABT5FED4_9GAMM|nr:hypothetical protein [Psychrosphaera sp. G1-22]MDC2889404.1 hypothetical protein [Psychrosphaera sp. G1-22]